MNASLVASNPWVVVLSASLVAASAVPVASSVPPTVSTVGVAESSFASSGAGAAVWLSSLRAPPAAPRDRWRCHRRLRARVFCAVAPSCCPSHPYRDRRRSTSIIAHARHDAAKRDDLSVCPRIERAWGFQPLSRAKQRGRDRRPPGSCEANHRVSSPASAPAIGHA